ncbi:hypothetical protein Tco_1508395 [Tanacetum coccineum]
MLLNDQPENELTDLMHGPVYTETHTTFLISIQAKAKKLVAKARHTKLNFKQVVEKKFKEYDQKLEALSTIIVPEAIEKSVQVKVLIEVKKQLPTHVPKEIANFIKPRLNNTVLEVMKNNLINLFTTPSPTTTDDLLEMKLKTKLYKRMYQNKSFDTYEIHQHLHNILILPMTVKGRREVKEGRMQDNPLLNRQRKIKLPWILFKMTFLLINPKTEKKNLYRNIPTRNGFLRSPDNLLKMLNEMGRGNVTLDGREWTKNDIKRSKAMLEKIDKTLKHGD